MREKLGLVLALAMFVALMVAPATGSPHVTRVNAAVVFMSVRVKIVTVKTVAATSGAINARTVFANARENYDIVRKTVKGVDIIANIFFQSRQK